uniref:Capsid protein n=1 Tax=Cressdnaviricota sp. TaxID=2748378 RepID=A0A4D6IWI4_9VIRU|nr:capsid protein [Cressdnaviricota sp.]
MATNFVKAKFQEIYDMGTVSGRTTILGIHTPQGVHVQNLLGGFFRQFRKFRYCGCSVTMVPAAQLPADPLQVSFEAGELTVDPRDLLNPILFHGCHGESLNEILNNYISNADMTNTSSVIESRPTLAETEAGYYSALSDPSFRKFGIQSGAKVNLKPMVHPLVLTNPLVPSESKTTLKRTISGQQGATAVLGELTGNIRDMDNNTDQVFYGGIQNPVPLAPLVNHEGLEFAYGITPQMFSNGLRPLGWLPTTTFPPAPKVGENKVGTGTGSTYEVTEYTIGPTILPKLFMGFFMLPPSYTQEMYFRLIITHYFEFKEFTTCLGYNPNGPKYSYKETIPEPSGGASKAEATSLEIIDGNVELTTDGVY